MKDGRWQEALRRYCLKLEVKLRLILLDSSKCLNCQKNDISAKETYTQRVETAQWGNYFPSRPTEEAEPSIPFDIKH